MIDDSQAEYRAAAERHRHGLQDPGRLTSAYLVSITGVVVLAGLLIISTFHR
ncbi:hypothetical protein ACWC5I_27670 [Kitasatospora sp. NPDC001574]